MTGSINYHVCQSIVLYLPSHQWPSRINKWNFLWCLLPSYLFYVFLCFNIWYDSVDITWIQ